VAVNAQRDPGVFRERFGAWLATRTGGTDVTLGELGGPAFSGFSNETVLVDASWTVGAVRHVRGLAVRLEPSAHQVFPDIGFERQVQVIRALDPTPVRVPRIPWFEEDASVLGSRFFVMDRIDGKAPTDNPPYHVAGWLHEVSPEIRERIWLNGLDAMSDVHCLDPAILDFLDHVGAREQIARDRAYLAWTLKGRSHPIVEETLDRLESSAPSESAEPAVVWGDARIGNMLFDDAGEVLAVLDWEMVSIGDPIADLVWFILLDRHHSESMGVARLEGFPSYDDTLARWEAATGRSTKAFPWWLLLGAARWAAIMTRVMDLMEESGLMPGAGQMAFENTAVNELRAILDKGNV
jgi:aminoglycoside phosphotransferase (APT) family kinase protein